jgi:hypothetical protein
MRWYGRSSHLATGRVRVKPGILAVQRRRWAGCRWLAAAGAVGPGRAAVRSHARHRTGGDGCRAGDERARVPSLNRQRLAIAASAIGAGDRDRRRATPGHRAHGDRGRVAGPSSTTGTGHTAVRLNPARRILLGPARRCTVCRPRRRPPRGTERSAGLPIPAPGRTGDRSLDDRHDVLRGRRPTAGRTR